ncbi:HNH endonuclease signature motif containing protein [Segatella sinensis]|uniref:HNH endonuclease signature motif containing protein n=1 Tax=Segatella sinensis TaxID=3085167 RepID=A0ABV1G275_9BACT
MSNLEKYTDLQADFYHYMVKFGGIAKKTSGDYVTRMKFLAHDYSLDETLTKEKIDEILRQEDFKRQERSVYTSKKSQSDFRAGLNKFLAFINSDYHKRIADSIITEIKAVENDNTIKMTEKDSIVKSRIGQGIFRKGLIEYWHGCAISQCPLTWMLIASHIKPWRDADNQERLDPYNGLLLLPNYDKLFDLGYISFNSKGKIMYSRLLDKFDRETIGLTNNLHLVKLEEQHLKYLKYHNDNCFLL